MFSVNWEEPYSFNHTKSFRHIKMDLDPIEVKIKLLTDTATMPTKAHPTDACFDIYADIPVDNSVPGISVKPTYIAIRPHETVMIHTGFATAIPEGYWAPIFARSGLASKQGLRPAQGVPVIDAPYRGEWLIPLHNDSLETRYVRQGDRICQFMILPVLPTNLVPVDELDSTDRGEGGFGSSGV